MENRLFQPSRWMTSVDYAAWVAVRSVGEAVTRSKSIEPAKVEAYMLSPDFSIAAYKGIKVTYRPWNGQLRQRHSIADRFHQCPHPARRADPDGIAQGNFIAPHR